MRFSFLRLAILNIIVSVYLWASSISITNQVAVLDILETPMAIRTYAVVFSIAIVFDILALILDRTAISIICLSVDVAAQSMLLVALVSDAVIFHHNPFFTLVWATILLNTISLTFYAPIFSRDNREAVRRIENIAHDTVRDHPELINGDGEHGE